MPNLDEFTRAYITTMLWSSHDESDESGGKPMDENYSLEDIAPAALERILADCANFQDANSAILSAAIETGQVRCGPDFDETERAGHDFWLTRCYHGAGFWDGGWPEPYADQLTEAARAFGNLDPYIGDNGQVYLS